MTDEFGRKPYEQWEPTWEEPVVISYGGFKVELTLMDSDLEVAIFRGGRLIRTTWAEEADHVAGSTTDGRTTGGRTRLASNAAADMAAVLRAMEEEDDE